MDTCSGRAWTSINRRTLTQTSKIRRVRRTMAYDTQRIGILQRTAVTNEDRVGPVSPLAVRSQCLPQRHMSPSPTGSRAALFGCSLTNALASVAACDRHHTLDRQFAASSTSAAVGMTA